MVPLGSIPFHYDKKTRRTIPIFLSQKDEEIITKAVTIFDANQGINRSDYVNESFLQNFKDFRRATLLHEILRKHFFGFRSISDGFSPKERIRIWKAIPKMMSEGFSLSSEHRQEILGELARNLSMDNPDVVEERLFYDHRDYQQLIQTNSPSTGGIISEYNRLILKTIIQHSRWVRFSIDPKANLEGDAFKKLLFLAKRHGVHFEVFLKDHRRIIELMGPKRLVQRGGRYTASLGRTLKAAAAFALGGEQRFDPSIEFGLPRGKGERTIQLSREALAWVHEEKDEEKAVFDSKVEKRLFYQLKSPQWKISREPFLHFEKESLIFLPDFQLDLLFSQATVYLEVVGFWTKEYLEKKVQKLDRLPSNFDNLLLLVDSALAFPQTRFPTFYYQSLKSLPVGEILGFLDKKYVQPYSQLLQKELLEKADFLTGNIAQALNSHFLSQEEIQEIIGCQDSKISSRVVEEIIANGKLKDCTFIPNFGLVHQHLANRIRETISPIVSAQGVQPWSRIEAALIEVVPGKVIEPILKLAGFEVVWKGLTQKFVRATRKVA